MTRVIVCEGAPRDLGRAQGSACREALRERCGSGFITSLRALLGADAASARALRDVRRHFPQQSEQLEGIARGAGLLDAVVGRAMIETLARRGGPLAAVPCDGATLVAAALPDALCLRRSRTEGRFAALEVTLPELTTALLGVNEAGLAVAASPSPAASAGCAAPAALLVRDCLERFAAVGPALEWCLSRPAGSGASLLLADAAGDVAGLELAGEERALRRPSAGVLALGPLPFPPREAAKRLADRVGGGADPAGLQRALGGAGVCVCADPAGRRLWLDGDWTGV